MHTQKKLFHYSCVYLDSIFFSHTFQILQHATHEHVIHCMATHSEKNFSNYYQSRLRRVCSYYSKMGKENFYLYFTLPGEKEKLSKCFFVRSPYRRFTFLLLPLLVLLSLVDVGEVFSSIYILVKFDLVELWGRIFF